MRIGFLMGSFDPIHIGHINMIREAINSNVLDKIVVVPAMHNPGKKNKPVPFFLRLDMVRAAIKPFEGICEASDIESRFIAPFYSYKPLRAFREHYIDDELYILCGTDTANKIQYWGDAKEKILPYYKIMEIRRPGIESKVDSDVVIESTLMVDISSTMIRESIKNGKEVYPLVPDEVLKMIKQHHLYAE